VAAGVVALRLRLRLPHPAPLPLAAEAVGAEEGKAQGEQQPRTAQWEALPPPEGAAAPRRRRLRACSDRFGW